MFRGVTKDAPQIRKGSVFACAPCSPQKQHRFYSAEKRAHPHAAVAVHPECTPEVRAAADFVGSTAEIVGYARGRGEGEMIVGTEPGVLWALRRQCPRMTFYPVTPQCADMKRNTLEGVRGCLESGRGEIVMDEALMRGARISLERMLALAK